jgi:putative membrane protein
LLQNLPRQSSGLASGKPLISNVRHLEAAPEATTEWSSSLLHLRSLLRQHFNGAPMSRLAKSLVLFVIVFHALVFVIEAFLWMRPGIYEFSVPRMNGSLTIGIAEQALAMKTVFVNQGFYNLFLAVAGVAGLILLSRGKTQAGHALVCYMCASAVGAGVVLAFTTIAYGGAVLQALPAAIALALMFRSSSSSVLARAGA